MKSLALLPLLILVLVLAATSTGVFYQSGGAPIHQITIRGERATFQGSGLYRYDPVAVAREGVVWDIVDLVVALPLFIVSIILARRKLLRGRIMLLGLLFYFFYRYLMFATMSALNFMFPAYILIIALSGIAFFTTLYSIDIPTLPDRCSDSFPRRLLIGYGFGAGVVITLLWSRLIASVLASDRFPDEYAGMTTLQTQAIDLGLVVPLMISTSVLLIRRSPWGYLLAGVTVTFGMMLCIVIPAWIAVPAIQDGVIKPVEAAPFLALCIAGLVLAWKLLRGIES